MESVVPTATTMTNTSEAKRIGDALGVDWSTIDLLQFQFGLDIELEHGSRDPETNISNDDQTITAKIAWAHLKEFPDYYTRLARLEREAAAYWDARR